ncbi:MAG: glycosyltransferase family 4 protein [candidate division WOR-3 bacterium]
MKICIVTDAFLPSVGGIENHVLHLGMALKQMGHDVLVVTHAIPGHITMAEQVEPAIPVLRLPGALLVFRDHDIALDPRMFPAFGRVLDEFRPDIVHGQSEGSLLVYGALALARRRRVPTVITRHSIIGAKPRLVRPALHLAARLFSAAADGLIAVSRACALEADGFRGPMKVIPNGVDITTFSPSPTRRAQTRQEFGYGPQDIVIGFVGRLHTTKGIPLLFSLFYQLAGAHDHVRLLVAGPGPLRRWAETQAAGKGTQVRVLGAQPYDRVARLLNATDVFALPSRSEGFGISVLEAMACGVPSVAFNRWGLKELIDNGRTGLLADSPDQFYCQLESLCTNAQLRQKLGEAARRKASEAFCWERVAAETVAFYRELVARPRSE